MSYQSTPHETKYCRPLTVTNDRLEAGQDTGLPVGSVAEVVLAVVVAGPVVIVAIEDGTEDDTEDGTRDTTEEDIVDGIETTGEESVDGNGPLTNLAPQTASLE